MSKAMMGYILALFAFLILVTILAPKRPGPDMALGVDQCILAHELDWCTAESYTPDEQAKCRKDAPLVSTRFNSAIPAHCKEKR